MNSFIKTLAFCALLGASGGAYAAPVLFPNGDFASAPTRGSWAQEFGGGTTTFNYPTSGGNPGGYGTMNNSGGWGIWVNSNNAPFTPAEMSSLGLVPGNGYTFFMDMKIETGAPNNILGRIKFEWAGVPGQTEEFVRTLTGDPGTWQRYTYNVIIPAGATGFKVVPVVSDNAFVGFDNIGFESVPYFVAPTPPPPPPTPTDVVLNETFEVASPNWGVPFGSFPATVTFDGGQGNPPGSTVLNVAGTGAVGDNFFVYSATGIDFGDGPVEISFDIKRNGDLIGTAVHANYNGNQVNNIGPIENSTFTNIKRTFNLNQGFLTNTFTLQFQFAMGPVPGNGGTIVIDNIVVKTNLPGSAPPTTASIASGKLVDWDVVNPDNSHQPQESAVGGTNDVDWTNLGPPITNPAVSSIFDSTPSAFYRVQETSPTILDNQVFNPGFEFTANPPADAWNTIDEILGTVTIQQSFPGGYLPTGGSNMLVLEVRNSPGVSGTGKAEIRSDQFPVNEGVTYNFSFSAANAITSGVSGVPQYVIYFYDTFGSIIETPIIGRLREPPFNVTDEWTRVETTVEIPADVIGVQISFAVTTGPLSSETFVTLIDDVSFDTGEVLTPSVTNTIPSTANPAVDVSWKTVTGRDYQVESSTSLQGWGNFGDSVAGDGSIFSVTDLITPPRKFYRVLETSP